MNKSIQAEMTASEPQDRVTELIEQQTAISGLLRTIASSPHDLQPHSRRSSLSQIGDLDRLVVRESRLDVGIVQADVLMS